MTIELLRPEAAFAKASAAGPAAPAPEPEPTPEPETTSGEPAPALPGNGTLDGLARMAGVAELARAAGEPVGPREVLEEALVHELMAGHAFAMNVLCQANNQFLSVDGRAGDFDHLTRLNQATARTGMVGVRMMEAVQRGILLLDRLRHGIRYHHRVERVFVAPEPGPKSESES